MSVPGGGSVSAGGVTVVGVLPTHRRRGVLTAMMKAQLEDCRARGDRSHTCGRRRRRSTAGSATGSRRGSVRSTCARERTRFAQPFEPRGTVRLVELEEAAKVFPPLYDQMFAQRPGMFSRNKAWWETRKLNDDPARRRGGPLNRALLELDGKPAGYALYRVAAGLAAGFSSGKVTIQEVVTPTPEAARELWRWLLDFDWTSQLTADLLPLDHPLFLLLAEPRRMKFQVNDGVWVRILDVPGALSARTFSGDGAVVLDVRDGFMPETAGATAWLLTASSAPTPRRRCPRHLRARLRLSRRLHFRQLAESFRMEELWTAPSRAPMRCSDVDRALVRRDLLSRRPPS